jgi:hypothetical protein
MPATHTTAGALDDDDGAGLGDPGAESLGLTDGLPEGEPLGLPDGDPEPP